MSCLPQVVNNAQGRSGLCGILVRDTLHALLSCSLLKDYFISIQVVSASDALICGPYCWSPWSSGLSAGES